ncbi:DUF2911 domain-containing protein [Polaribacter sp.]|nr:DUF2911 domain-containing protein [Polaribacter sp.]
MKKSIFSTVIIAIAFLTTSIVSAQKFRPIDKSPADIASYPSRGADKIVKVVYSRPQLKGRDLNMLAKPGKVWRTGANEATEIIFYQDVTFGGKNVKVGTYSLFTIPNENEWTVILNKTLNVWGSFSYKEADDVVRVKGTVSKADEPIEAFSIMFDKDMTLKMGWGETVVAVPITK